MAGGGLFLFTKYSVGQILGLGVKSMLNARLKTGIYPPIFLTIYLYGFAFSPVLNWETVYRLKRC